MIVSKKTNHYHQSTQRKILTEAKKLDNFLTGIKWHQLKKENADKFRDYLASESQKSKTINNTLAFLSNIFNYAVGRELITTNPFVGVVRMKTKKNATNKRNFSMEELKNLFSGKHGTPKELLDALRFILNSGIRRQEFYFFNKNHILKDEQGIFWLNIKNAKRDDNTYRLIPVHKNILDLAKNTTWLDRLKKKYKTIDALGKALNRAIQKASKKQGVNLHRLRGNFIGLIDKRAMELNYRTDINLQKDLAGHTINHKKRKCDTDECQTILANHMNGTQNEITTEVYAQQQYKEDKLKVIGVLDDLSDLFAYRKLNTIPKIRLNKKRRIKKKSKKGINAKDSKTPL